MSESFEIISMIVVCVVGASIGFHYKIFVEPGELSWHIFAIVPLLTLYVYHMIFRYPKINMHGETE